MILTILSCVIGGLLGYFTGELIIHLIEKGKKK